MIRKLPTAVPESTLRRLDRISPMWAESFRRGEIPIDTTHMEYRGAVLDLQNSHCCVVGEAQGWDCTSSSCSMCSICSSDLVMIHDPEWIETLECFITHYEQAHMKEPEKEKVPVEAVQA